ncbi:PAS domain-containing sensor histidine kinase [Methylobacterium radiodurans]|uniref:Blue-light-activated histidine kinase n=1 Tax=Methylobacterium radiodurans TaxID=2202828 RepID=A0A2U8VY40_9HYPH|nr:PAS domain S-box protein [Methylobacterium radiodurans]AWN38182.1 PAS domain S-box protein [Methylobacterium radiodurans]
MTDRPADDARETGRLDSPDPRLVRLGESALLMRLALDAGDIGIWAYDPVADRLEWDGRTRALFGLGPDEPPSHAGTFLPLLHPQDRDAVDAAFRQALRPDGPGLLDVECRVRPPGAGGSEDVQRWLAVRGRHVVAGGRTTQIVGTVRDISRRMRAARAEEAVRERYRLVTRATNDAIWDWNLATDVVEWNEALTSAYGWEPHRVEPTGAWWLAQIHPADRDRVEEDIRAVIAGSAAEWRHEYRFRRGDGSCAEVLDRGYMVRDAEGRPLRIIGAMLDVTERNRSEAQFRAIFEGANLGIVQLDPRSLTVLRVNPKLCALWGAPAEAIVGRSVAVWTPEEDAEARDRLHRRLAGGEILQETLEKRYRRADGRIIWARVNLVSQVFGDDILTTAMIEDITQERLDAARRQALVEIGDALRAARGRGAVLAAAVSVIGRALQARWAGFSSLDGAAGLAPAEALWHRPGEAHPGVLGAGLRCPAAVALLRVGARLAVADIAHDPRVADDAPAFAALGTRAAILVPVGAHGRVVSVLGVHEAAPRTWTPDEIDFVREVAERVRDGLGRMQAEDQQSLRNRELSHRLKNTLAMVQAIVSQTLRDVQDLEVAKEALAARLVALGKAHDILLTGDSEGAAMAAVIAGALALHDDGRPGRFALSGPPVAVGPRAALSLALMIHELATNAAKYGALSLPDGRIAVAWSVVPDGADATVNLAWTERGGPPVVPPAHRGFGSRLIERGLAGAVGGAVSLDYAPEGLACRVAAPLSGFQAAE